MSDKKTVAHNLGKGRYVFDRAKNYIQSILYFVQFGMQVATVLALYKVGMFWLAAMAAGLVIFIGLFIWFMRFDIAHNLPAEHGWVWSINPKYQELVSRLERIEIAVGGIKRLERLLGELALSEIQGDKEVVFFEQVEKIRREDEAIIRIF